MKIALIAGGCVVAIIVAVIVIGCFCRSGM